jgi:hypothetical protein
MTGGCSMAAMIVKGPPQWGQGSIRYGTLVYERPPWFSPREPAFAVPNRSQRFCEQPGPAQAGQDRDGVSHPQRRARSGRLPCSESQAQKGGDLLGALRME